MGNNKFTNYNFKALTWAIFFFSVILAPESYGAAKKPIQQTESTKEKLNKCNSDKRSCNNQKSTLLSERNSCRSSLSTCENKLGTIGNCPADLNNCNENLNDKEKGLMNCKKDKDLIEINKNTCITLKQNLESTIKDLDKKVKDSKTSNDSISKELNNIKSTSAKCNNEKVNLDKEFKTCLKKYQDSLKNSKGNDELVQKLKEEVSGLKVINSKAKGNREKIIFLEKEKEDLKKSIEALKKENIDLDEKVSKFTYLEKELGNVEVLKKEGQELKLENAGMKDYILRLESKLKKYEKVPPNKFKIVSGDYKAYEDKIDQCVKSLSACNENKNPTMLQCESHIQTRNNQINQVLTPLYNKFNIPNNDLNSLVFETLNFETQNDSEFLNQNLSVCLAQKNELIAASSMINIETWESKLNNLNTEAESQAGENPISFYDSDPTSRECHSFKSNESEHTWTFSGAGIKLMSVDYVEGSEIWKTSNPDCAGLFGCQFDSQINESHNLDNYKGQKHGSLILEWEEGSCVFGTSDCLPGKTFQSIPSITIRINDKNPGNNPNGKARVCFQRLQGGDSLRHESFRQLDRIDKKTNLIYKEMLEELQNLKSNILNDDAMESLKRSVLDKLESNLGIRNE